MVKMVRCAAGKLLCGDCVLQAGVVEGGVGARMVNGRLQAGSLPLAKHAKSLQSCPTLCNPIDGSPPGSTVPGILQVRTLEWVAISFSNA